MALSIQSQDQAIIPHEFVLCSQLNSPVLKYQFSTVIEYVASLQNYKTNKFIR